MRRRCSTTFPRPSTRSTSTRCRATACWCSPPAARASGGRRRRSSRRGATWGSTSSPATPSCSRRRPFPATRSRSARILNQLSEKGVRVIDDSDGHYHVSGHANRPDLVTLQTLLRPQMIVPMHGEHRHLATHAALAAERGIAAAVAPNGTMLDLTGDAPRIVDAGRDRAGLPRRHGADRGDGRGRARAHPHGDARQGRGVDHHRRARPAARRRLGRGDGAARQPEDARRARGRAGGGDRPGARPRSGARSSATTRRSTS